MVADAPDQFGPVWMVPIAPVLILNQTLIAVLPVASNICSNTHDLALGFAYIENV